MPQKAKSKVHTKVLDVHLYVDAMLAKTLEIISQDGGKYWEFPGKHWKFTGNTGKFLNMT